MAATDALCTAAMRPVGFFQAAFVASTIGAAMRPLNMDRSRCAVLDELLGRRAADGRAMVTAQSGMPGVPRRGRQSLLARPQWSKRQRE